MASYYYFNTFILFLSIATINADLTDSKLLNTNSLLEVTGAGYLFPHSNECEDLLNDFSDSASNFTKCSIQNARPIRLCEKCIDQYKVFEKKYNELTTSTINGTYCKSVFISQDRLDVILKYHDNILNIWLEAHCSRCFDWSGGDPVLSNDTKHFNDMFNVTMTCIIQSLNPFKNNSDEVCDKCKQTYLQLDSYYKTLSTDAIGVDSICMDIVDSMNATRSIWSKSLNCCNVRKTPEIIFLSCTAIISLLPVLYYLVLRYCGPIRDLPNVLKQSRFKQSILRSVNGGIN